MTIQETAKELRREFDKTSNAELIERVEILEKQTKLLFSIVEQLCEEAKYIERKVFQ